MASSQAPDSVAGHWPHMRANDATSELADETSGGFFVPAYEENFAHVWSEAEGLITILTVIGAALVIWQLFVLINQFRKGEPAMRIVMPLIGGLLFASALIMPQVMIPFYLGLLDAFIGFLASLISRAS